MTMKLMPAFAVFVFGVLMFLAGLIAPESIRKPMEVFVQRSFPGIANHVDGQIALLTPAAVNSTKSATLPPTPIWEESLSIPKLLPEKAQYGLQVGKFSDAAHAQSLTGHLKALHLPFTKTIEVVDQAGSRSIIVPLGPYASLDEARAARSLIAQELNLNGPMTLILWPAALGPSANGAAAASSVATMPIKP